MLEEILRAGFQYHIAKPVDMSRLLGIVGILALKPQALYAPWPWSGCLWHDLGS